MVMAETLAEKIDWLFQYVPDAEGGRLYSAVAVATSIQGMLPGIDVTEDDVMAVRDGTDEHPPRELVEGFARVFGVSSAFLTSDEATIRGLQAQLDLLAHFKSVLRDGRDAGAQGSFWVGCIR